MHHHTEIVDSDFSKSVAVERQSSDRSKRGCEEPQNKRHIERDRDGDDSSRDSDHDRLSTCDRQLVCFDVLVLL